MKTFIGNPWLPLACVLLAAGGWPGETFAQKPPNRDGKQEVFLTEIPPTKGNVILSRPTNHSILASVFSNETTKAQVIYGRKGETAQIRSAIFELAAGATKEILLENLTADTDYDYRVVNPATGALLFSDGASGHFHTCRPPGASFTFTIQADSHLDGNCLPELYKICLANALADKPDFHVDLGDTFMTGKHPGRDSAALQYAAQRYYFGLIGHSAPVFFVLGNHDGEEAKKPEAREAEGLAVWSCLQRKQVLTNPESDTFYSGNSENHAHAGMLQNFYAWTWGDALFVVLDPYWPSRSTRGGKEPWNMTLGKAQYDWLARTLRTSQAKHKFVFIHQLVGGLDKSGRGGTEAARLFEWGGEEFDGSNTFTAHRPGWEKPIHALLRETKVDILFHGHDHFYAKQELDGVIYQLVPQPCQRNSRNNHADEYGYTQGDFFPSSGHLRVRVSRDSVTVDYIRSAMADTTRRDGISNRGTSASYTLGAAKDKE